MPSKKLGDKAKNDETSIIKSDPLQDINLSEQMQNALLLETLGESLLETLPVVGPVMNYVQKYQDKVDAARVTILLKKLRDKMESQEEFSSAIKELLTSSSGLNLFQKTLKILNRDHFDPNFIELLANCLKNISSTDIQNLFEELNYILSQIEKLSAQALLLLSQYEFWKGVRLERATNMSGQLIVGDWDSQTSNYFASNARLKLDRKGIDRIAHAFRELHSNGLVMLNNQTKSVELTQIGEEVLRQIS